MFRTWRILPGVLLAASLILSGCRATTSGAPDAGSGADSGASDLKDAGYTWYRDALPIVQAHCQQCHIPGGIAPFPLLTYQDASSHAGLISYALETGLMPPWKPAPACQSFLGDRSIPQSMKDVLDSWATFGAPAGNPADAPPPADAGLPGLPQVSVELDAGIDYTPTTLNGPDDYHCSILQTGLTQTTDVIGVNIKPGQPSLVHHVILFQTTAARAAQADSANPGHGWTCFGSPGTGDFNMVGGWVPGSPAEVFPAGTGIPLLAGNVIVLQVHYNMSAAAPQPDRTVAQLEYSPTPVPRPAVVVGPIDTGFAIPPNSVGYSHSYSWPVSLSGTIWGIQPHMHTKGTQINVSVSHNGQESCLIDIPQWNFSWQQMYFYETPLTATAGDVINLQCTWTNPTSSTVTFGEGTADEMCLAFLYATQ